MHKHFVMYIVSTCIGQWVTNSEIISKSFVDTAFDLEKYIPVI